MNKKEIHEKFFEDLHKSQMNAINNEIIKNNSKINDNIIQEARGVILGLLAHIDNNHRDDIPGKDNATLGALKWLKNNQS
tara:strand:- start:339 stop:578 length:240 start_codon:yes stop_codon:yes gene_type:complete